MTIVKGHLSISNKSDK